MMFAALALASAACYGAADFIGGMAARRADTIPVVIVSQAAGMILVALMLPLLGAPVPGRLDFLWSGAAGIAGGVGVALLYRALAVGVMSLVAPVTAVCGVVVPVVIAVVLLGERPAARPVSASRRARRGRAHQPGRRTDDRSARPAGRSEASPPGTGPRARVGRVHRPLLLCAGPDERRGGALAAPDRAGMFGRVLRRPGAGVGPFPAPAAADRGDRDGGGILDMLANLLYLLATRQGR